MPNLDEKLQTVLDLMGDGKRVSQIKLTDHQSTSHAMSTALSGLGAKANTDRDLIRTIHHFACTGGTLFSKCIASMPNTMVLNEVNPFYRSMPKRAGVGFTPTDLISLVHQSGEDLDTEVIRTVFMTGLAAIQKENWRTGRSLVIRDHTHSQYLTKNSQSGHETTLGILKTRFRVLSLVTVRDPIDSFLSLKRNGWSTHFQPSTFDEYCARYLKFLSDYQDVPTIRYEDFISHPKRTMREICAILKLDYNDKFQNLFSSFRFSGDSGRISSEISKRPRLEMSEEFLQMVSASDKYIELANLNGYTVHR